MHADQANRDSLALDVMEAIRPKVDWIVRENVRAQLRVYLKRILRKYGYPPDKEKKATETVLEQAEVLSEGWASQTDTHLGD